MFDDIKHVLFHKVTDN